MARATTCIYEGEQISIDDAIEIRAVTPKSSKILLSFRCTECGERVRPHKAGGNASAHFEHFERNPSCSLSHPAPD